VNAPHGQAGGARTRGGQLRAAWRALRAVLHVLRGLWIIRSEFGRLTHAQSQLIVREWSRRMLAIMGIALDVQGQPPAHGAVLMVANHISWLDILVMNAAHPSRFVSKADVQRWPLLGSLITGAGTLYIERESRRDALRVVHRMAERLRAGETVSVFPEGTTGDGAQLLPFHANLLQAAISASAPVQPVALRYLERGSGQPHPGPVFIGDDTLVASVWRTLRSDTVRAVVRYGTPQRAGARDRRAWSEALRAEVQAEFDAAR
jgi:1-acyl-sn-glycerol-3-phosphate acyltransferase